jgi:membrane protein required for colicin V production
MTFDEVSVVIVAVAAAAGAFTGARSQIAQLGGAAAGWAGARWLGPRLAPLLQGRLPAFAAHPVASVVAFAGCGLVAGVVLRAALGCATAKDGGGAHRGLGALLGGAQAAVFVWVVASALAIWARPLRLGPVDLDPARSDLVSLAAEHSALGGPVAQAGARARELLPSRR